MPQPDTLTLGKIVGVFGVKGWVKVFSHTEQRDTILDYSPWLLKVGTEWKAYKLKNGQAQGKSLIAQLEGVDSREQAELLVGCTIAIWRDQLKPLKQNEYYWADLIGLEVSTTTGLHLGKVSDLFETGSNDVLVVEGERERLVPWILGDVVREVDITTKQIIVDWDPDF